MVLCSVIRTVSRFGRSGITPRCRRTLYSTESKGRYYTRDHEWVTVDAGVGTVGISNYAQEALGEVVFVQLPEVGSAVASGDECGAVESVKAASEIVAPVSGTIVEKNSAVESTPSLINKSYFDEGWLFRVKLSAPDELKQLMDQTAYDKFLEDSH
ncbi:glycine cleavage system H protein-like [Pararge aegeria]|uniref:glycine cleavage system H protein-like n=1 Tax=Pararge aegeria TaxID=116150 RepID=UPI0019D1D8D3|nr:glycine cleavage system H protein-like [Pararge aegeria]